MIIPSFHAYARDYFSWINVKCDNVLFLNSFHTFEERSLIAIGENKLDAMKIVAAFSSFPFLNSDLFEAQIGLEVQLSKFLLGWRNTVFLIEGIIAVLMESEFDLASNIWCEHILTDTYLRYQRSVPVASFDFRRDLVSIVEIERF